MMTLSITTFCHYVECRILFIVMLNVVMQSVVMLSVVMLNAVMLSVVAPNYCTIMQWSSLQKTVNKLFPKTFYRFGF
jgi:hypothetical protein